jgi:hypothetical protein
VNELDKQAMLQTEKKRKELGQKVHFCFRSLVIDQNLQGRLRGHKEKVPKNRKRLHRQKGESQTFR